jgi:hypothetical protein
MGLISLILTILVSNGLFDEVPQKEFEADPV